MTTLLRPDLVRLDENLGHDKTDVLRVLADMAGHDEGTAAAPALARDTVVRAEVLSGRVPGSALLVLRSRAVQAPTLVLARLAAPVDFGADDLPADLVLLVVTPIDDDAGHHQLVARAADVLTWPQLGEALRHASTPAEAAQLLQTALVTDVRGTRPADHPAGPASASRGARARSVLMTGVSYMVPFVAGGGLLIALGYLFGGYDITGTAQVIVNQHDVADLPDPDEFGLAHVPFDSPALAYLGALFYTLGATAFALFVPVMAGYIAFAVAGRPGIAPGFVMGALAVDLVGFGTAQSGFLGAIVGGGIAGIVTRWVAGWSVPSWARGLMPVMLTPLLTTGICGVVMITALNRPLAAVTRAATTGLDGLSDGSMVVLGVVLGLMMAFDIGGPLNKTAYTFAVTGVTGSAALASDAPQLEVMAAVMLAGMTPPLALAVATRVRPSLFSPEERDSGKTAAVLGAAFITEGAIPYAAADPLRVIPAIVAGSAVTGGLSMALGVTSPAPHGGLLVLFTVGNIAGFCLALAAGVVVTTLLVSVLKSLGNRPADLTHP